MAIDMLGDLLAVTDGIICHQVNCQGKMGTGIALKIRHRYPIAYQAYIDHFMRGQLVLGRPIFVGIPGSAQTSIWGKGLVIAHLPGQEFYGRNGRYTDYAALRNCLRMVQQMSITIQQHIYIPRGMGCVNAGGDWSIVRQMIDEETPNAIILDYNSGRSR
jgi:O-acetyl-ADP-ribose deacetylase (regulator of RNase III)